MGKYYFFSLIGIFLYDILLGLGIGTEFNNIVIENLQIGEKYNLSQLCDLPVRVQNLSDRKAKIKIQPVVPTQESLKAGYEVIPSTDWVEVLNPELWVEPNSYGETDLILKIPEDKNLLGRKFQVNIWCVIDSVEFMENFLFTAPGVEGCMMFTVAPDIPKKRQKRKFLTLNFDLEPKKLYSILNSTFCYIGEIRIKNTSKYNLEFSILQINHKDINVSLEPGYVSLPQNCLWFSSPKIKIKKRKSGSIKVFFNPINFEVKGDTKYFGVIEVKTVKGDIEVNKYVKLFLDSK